MFSAFCSLLGFSIGRQITPNYKATNDLHKNAHGVPMFDCSAAPFFTVEQKYGDKDEWEHF